MINELGLSSRSLKISPQCQFKIHDKIYTQRKRDTKGPEVAEPFVDKPRETPDRISGS